MHYPSKINYCKTFEKNNSKIGFNILYIKEKKKYSTYTSKHNL